jgi:hypothetical protein
MDFKIAYTNEEITPCVGMVLLNKMLKRIGFSSAVEGCKDLPQPGSNRSYKLLSVIESFLVSIWCGVNKFLHTEVTRHGQTLCDIFGWAQMPGNDTFKRFFRKFYQADRQGANKYFYRRIFDNFRFDNYTLDCDSTILTRYSNQEDNPHKPGCMLHYPVMAFIADLKLVANFWLRSGNTSSSENFISFLSDTLDNLHGKNISLLRLDSGFNCREVLEFTEGRDFNYIVAARFYEPIQYSVSGLKRWIKFDEGIGISEIHCQSPSWDKSRRMVYQHIKRCPNATDKQPRLFSDDEILNQYRYSAYITNLSLSGTDVWQLYRGRADAENRIRELKYDFGFDSLIALFRQVVLNTKVQQTLSTLRFKTFAIGAYFEKVKDKTVLRMAIRKKRRKWFSGLWEASKVLNLPFEFILLNLE